MQFVPFPISRLEDGTIILDPEADLSVYEIVIHGANPKGGLLCLDLSNRKFFNDRVSPNRIELRSPLIPEGHPFYSAPSLPFRDFDQRYKHPASFTVAEFEILSEKFSNVSLFTRYEQVTFRKLEPKVWALNAAQSLPCLFTN